jgi:hypothetical protein
MSEDIPIERLDWAIAARERSQRLLLALYDFGQQNEDGLAEHPQTEVFSCSSAWRFRSGARRFLQTH